MGRPFRPSSLLKPFRSSLLRPSGPSLVVHHLAWGHKWDPELPLPHQTCSLVTVLLDPQRTKMKTTENTNNKYVDNM